MAATNTTTNYGFPLYNESDSTSWSDFNKLSTDVDTQIKNVADSGGTTSGQVQELTEKVDTLTQTVNAQDAVITQQGTEITQLTNDAATTDEAIDGLQQKTTANETNISNLSTQVTSTILPEVEKNTTDISVLGQNVNVLSTTVSQQGTRITELEGKVPNDLGTQLTTLTSGLDEVQGKIAGGFRCIKKQLTSPTVSISPKDDGISIRNNVPFTTEDKIYLVDILLATEDNCMLIPASFYTSPAPNPDPILGVGISRTNSGFRLLILFSPRSSYLNIDVGLIAAKVPASGYGNLEMARFRDSNVTVASDKKFYEILAMN